MIQRQAEVGDSKHGDILRGFVGGWFFAGRRRQHRACACPHPSPLPQAGEGAVPFSR
ncbi:hypothetical protein AZ78_2881 [Lysobacter capsici AZ78]|uniref:Uncharacterized protein n=1 Tax=Lysobacter capsici AZ78 TaxID=1444315 RepID=A0A120AGZ1_9GAMM|nr:hypothetical protein AZ78_2881 [Lysobacter capsici AZ78]